MANIKLHLEYDGSEKAMISIVALVASMVLMLSTAWGYVNTWSADTAAVRVEDIKLSDDPEQVP